MPSSQIFAKAYTISDPAANGSFAVTGTRYNSITLSDTANTGDNTSVLGDIGTPSTTAPKSGDELSLVGQNNTVAYYYGVGTVGTETGMVIYDPQGKNYYFLSNNTGLATNSSGAVAVSVPGTSNTGTNHWLLAGDTTPTAPTGISVTDDAAPITGTVASGGGTNDTTPTIAGTAPGAGLTISVYNGGTLLGTTTSGTDGSWSFTPTLPSSAGTAYSLTATATNPGMTSGATSANSSAYTFTLDTAAPAVSSIAASGAGITNGTGSLNAGKTVTFTVNAAEALTVTGTPTLTLSNGATATYAAGSGTTALSFTYTVAAADGNTADLSVSSLNLPSGAAIRDGAGNAVTFNAATVGNPAGSLAIDTAAPSAPTIGTVHDDVGLYKADLSANASTDDKTLTLSGTAEANATVQVFNTVGGVSTLVGTVVAGSDGKWSLDTSALPEGSASLTAKATDAAGNTSVSSAAFAATVDTVAPTTSATVALASDTGASSTDGITSNPALAGTAPANATVVIKDGSGAVVATVTAGSNGAWSFANASATEGARTYTAQVADTAGNLGPVSSTLAVTYDKTAPTATTTVALAQDTGASSTDGVTSNPALSGVATGYGSGDTITVKDNGVAVGTATIGTGGAWSFTPTGTAAADGSHSYTASVTDSAGNSGTAAATSPAATTLDAAAPTATTTVALASDTGASSTDGVTSSPALAGTASNGLSGQTVTIKDGTAVVGTATTGANGAWSFANAGATEGAHSYTAAITDTAGNSGTSSGALAVTYDKTAPTTGATVALASDTGASSTDGITSSPALAGTAPANATVVIKEGNTVVATVTADGTGAWSYANAGATEGAHSYTAQVADTAGNLGPASGALAVTYDKTAPTETTTVRLSSDTGSSSTDGVTSNPALTGTVSSGLSGQTVTIKDGTAVVGTATTGSGGAWTFANAGAANGPHSYTAAVTDTAGNLGTAAATSPASTTLDKSAPATPTGLALAQDTGASSTDGVTSDPTIKGFAEAGSTVVLKVGSAEVGRGTADATTGAFSITPVGLSQGANTVTATATDAAGNATATPASIAFTLDSGAPSVSSIAASGPGIVGGNGSLGAGSVVTFTVSASEALTVSGAPTLALSNGATAAYAGVSGNSLTFTYTVAAGQDTADLAVNGLNLPNGATIKDAAGNAVTFGGAVNPAGTLRIDTAAPSAPTIGPVSDDAGTVTGALSAGGVTDDTTPTLNIGLPANAVAGDTVRVLNGATQVGSHVLTAADIAAGNVSVTTSAVTGDGAKTLTATVTDAAGNTSGAVSFAYALDTAPPNATTTIGLAQDTGASPTDGVTSNPALAGVAIGYGSGETVTVMDNGVAVGTAAIGTGGAWSFTPTGAAAADGSHSYTAAVTDAAGNSGTAAATSPAATAVDKAADSDVAADLTDATVLPNNGGAEVAFTLSGLDAGSSAAVTFTGSGGGAVTRAFSANGAQTADVSGLSGDVTATVLVTDKAGNTAAGQGDALQADPVCFMAGTLVRTPGGERAVETLRAGDLVLTAGGGTAPVRWLGRQTVSTRFADPMRVLPVRVVAGALGEALPARDLLVSADHALLVDGVLAQAGALVNGTTIRREAAVPEVFTYWHVELADHALVLAEGVPAETFIDNVARLAFDNWAEHEAAEPAAPMAEMALPRAKSARQVPQATRRRLAERAAVLLGARTAAA